MVNAPPQGRGRPRKGTNPCCAFCKSSSDFVVKHGKERNGAQRFKCNACKRTFNDRTGTAFAGLKTRPREVARTLAALDEGMGVLGLERVFGHAEATVKRWLVNAARHVLQVMERLMRGVDAKFIQLDELRTYFAKKEQEVWVWKSMDCVSKLWRAVHVSLARSVEECKAFLKKTARVIAQARLETRAAHSRHESRFNHASLDAAGTPLPATHPKQKEDRCLADARKTAFNQPDYPRTPNALPVAGGVFKRLGF